MATKAKRTSTASRTRSSKTAGEAVRTRNADRARLEAELENLKSHQTLTRFLQAEIASGPALPAEAAAFWYVVKPLFNIIRRETLPGRRVAVLEHTLRLIKAALQIASGHQTVGEQEIALRSALAALAVNAPPPGDLRLDRGISDALSTLAEYQQIHAVVTPLLQGRGEGGSARSRLSFASANRKKLEALYPELARRPDLAAEAGTAPPKTATLLILKARYGLSTDHLDARLKKARARFRRLRTSK